MVEIPKVKIAVIGGSAIMGSGFPKDFGEIEILEKDMVYDTPFGPTAPFTHSRIAGKEFLFVNFHGITEEIHPAMPDSAFERVFYTLREAGVKKIVSCALCGSTNRMLDPGDFVVVDDFVDYTTNRCQALWRSLKMKGIRSPQVSYTLHRPFCSQLRALLIEEAQKKVPKEISRVFTRGIAGVWEGPRLESSAEILLRWTSVGLDVVTQHLVPEVFLAREIGSCYGAFEFVSNYGTGLMTGMWRRSDIRRMGEKYGRSCAEVIAAVLKRLDPNDISCGCMQDADLSTTSYDRFRADRR